MSITFYNPKKPVQYDNDFNIVGDNVEVNMSNVNAKEVISFLRLPCDDTGYDMYGQITARDLSVACKRALLRLNNVSGLDPALPSSNDGNFFFMGRAEGYLQSKVQLLLTLTESCDSDEDVIVWG